MEKAELEAVAEAGLPEGAGKTSYEASDVRAAS
jgi:hypothetical protein